VDVYFDETAPRHLTTEEFKKSTAVNSRGIVNSAIVNWLGIVNSVAINCRRVLWSFNGVFQPYNMCEQQFSCYMWQKEWNSSKNEVMMWYEITKIPRQHMGVHAWYIKKGVSLSFFYFKILLRSFGGRIKNTKLQF
jgi:hypothetical protein